MEPEDPSELTFGFGLEDSGQLIYCETIMGESGFGVLFNGNLVAEINQDDNLQWEVTKGGPLEPELVEEIGRRIETRYD